MMNMVEHLDEKIELVLSCPEAWGGLDSIEPLILMLTMCRRYAAFEDEDNLKLMRAYRKHLAELFGGSSARLADRLLARDGDDSDHLVAAVQALRSFAESQAMEGSTAKEEEE